MTLTAATPKSTWTIANLFTRSTFSGGKRPAEEFAPSSRKLEKALKNQSQRPPVVKLPGQRWALRVSDDGVFVAAHFRACQKNAATHVSGDSKGSPMEQTPEPIESPLPGSKYRVYGSDSKYQIPSRPESKHASQPQSQPPQPRPVSNLTPKKDLIEAAEPPSVVDPKGSPAKVSTPSNGKSPSPVRELAARVPALLEKARQSAAACADDNHSRKAMRSKYEFVEDLRKVLGEIHKLKNDQAALSERGARAALDNMQRQCLRAVLTLHFPITDNDDVGALVDELMQVDNLLAGTGKTEYSVDKLLAVLCGFQAATDRRQLREKLVSLLGNLRDIVRSVTGGRDGSALGKWIGINPDLDDAFTELWIRATRDVMERDSEGEFERDASMREPAERLVSKEVELIQLKSRVIQMLSSRGVDTREFVVRAPLNFSLYDYGLRDDPAIALLLDAMHVLRGQIIDSVEAEQLRTGLKAVAADKTFAAFAHDRLSSLAAFAQRPVIVEPQHASSQEQAALESQADRDLDIVKCARQGLSSHAEAEAAYASINKVMREVRPYLGDFTISVLTAGKDEDKAKRLGERLAAQHQLAKDATPLDALVAPKFSQSTTDKQTEIAQAIEEHEGHRVALKKWLGKDVDRPQGLRSCRILKLALDLYSNEAAKPEEERFSEDAREQLKQYCGQLRGFNIDRLHTPFGSTRPFTFDDLAIACGTPGASEAVNAVIAIREFDDRMKGLRADLQGRLASRMANVNDDHEKLLRDAIRAAILNQVKDTPICQFRPSDHAVAVKIQLQKWGLDAEAWSPEIDMALSCDFGPDELRRWESEAPAPPPKAPVAADNADAAIAVAPDTPATRSQRVLKRLRSVFYVKSTPLRTEADKTKLIDSLSRLQLGTRVRLAAGKRVEISTGNIQIPGTGAGIGGRFAAGSVNSIEFGRGVDGYELVLRDGSDGRGSLTGTYGVPQAQPLSPLKAEAYGTVEYGSARVGGVMLRFPDTEQGRIAMQDALRVLLRDEPVKPRDFGDGTQVAPIVERRAAPKVTIGARAGVEFGFDHAPEGEAAPAAFIGPQVAASYTRARTTQVARNTRGSVTRKFFDRTVDVNFALVGRVTTGTAPLNGAAAVSGEVARVDKNYSRLIRTREKVVRASDGSIRRNTEIDVQSYIATRDPKATVRALARAEFGGEFDNFMDRMGSDPDPEKRKMAAGIDRLLETLGPNDLISLVCTLDEGVMAKLNARIGEARMLREGRRSDMGLADAQRLAREIDDEVAAELADRRNYAFSRIRVQPSYERTSSAGLNLGFLNVGRYVELTGAFPDRDYRWNRPEVLKMHDLRFEEPGAMSKLKKPQGDRLLNSVKPVASDSPAERARMMLGFDVVVTDPQAKRKQVWM